MGFLRTKKNLTGGRFVKFSRVHELPIHHNGGNGVYTVPLGLSAALTGHAHLRPVDDNSISGLNDVPHRCHSRLAELAVRGEELNGPRHMRAR